MSGGRFQPSTSFDCSGFISWVINHCGWNVGRLTAQGLLQHLHPRHGGAGQARRPCVFRRHLRHPGVSHVGLYVGNSVMLHCGDPIPTRTLIQATGSNIFTVTGVCRDAPEEEEFYQYCFLWRRYEQCRLTDGLYQHHIPVDLIFVLPIPGGNIPILITLSGRWTNG